MGKTVGMIVGVVVMVAIAVAAPYLAPIALGALGVTATATAVAIATAVIGAALSIGAAMAFRALGIGAPTTRSAIGPPQVFRQAVANSFIVYGKRRVGGLLVFFHGRPGITDGNHLRYFVIAVAGHRCQGVVTWMLNDEAVTVDGAGKVTSGKYANYAWLWFVRGTDTDAANATFVSECGGKWTTAHQGKGIAKIYAKFALADAIIEAGMPNITAIIEGRDEILDPRTATTGYSRNASLIFYDWMQIPREEGGFGAYPDEIPEDAWISAQANVCDETVNSAPRYAIDAVITTGAAPSEIRDVLVVNQAGSYTFSGGKHLMRPGYWVPVTANLSEDDLASAITVSAFATGDNAANEVQGTYISPTDNYIAAPFTTQTLGTPPADIRQIDLDLAFVTNKNQADRIARIMLNRAQADRAVVWPMNIAGLKIRAMDTVQLDSPRYGLSNYAWTVSNWGLSSEWGVVLSLKEENEEIYGAPSVVAPPTPPAIDPVDPVQTSAEIRTQLMNTYASGLTLTGSDAGATATVGLSAFTLNYPGSAVAIGAGSVTGLSFSTLYYMFGDVDAVGDSTPTFGASTTYAGALNSTTNPLRVYLGQSITTPADGAGNTGGQGAGGGYGGGGIIP